jgi:TorA maturation chaperone TorD
MQALTDTLAADLASECLYRFLSQALNDPHGTSWCGVTDPENHRIVTEAAILLRGEATLSFPLGLGEQPAAQLDLQPVLTLLDRPVDNVREEYNRVFGLVPARECPPYETEYCSTSEPFFRAQQMADVAGFYRAFGVEPARASPDRPDYLPVELEFMAFLLLKRRLAALRAGPEAVDYVQICDEAQRKFFADHLAWWVPAFATGLKRKAGHGLYAVLAGVLAAFIPLERRRLGVAPVRVPLQADLIERPEEQANCVGCV